MAGFALHAYWSKRSTVERPSAPSRPPRRPDTQWDCAMRHDDGAEVAPGPHRPSLEKSLAPRPRQRGPSLSPYTLGVFRIMTADSATWRPNHASVLTEQTQRV